MTQQPPSDNRLDQFRRRDQQGQKPTSTTPVTAPQQQQATTPPLTAAADEEELEPPRRFDPSTGKEIYQAFRVRIRKTDRLEIRPVLGSWQMPRYFDLSDMTVNGRTGTQIILHFSLYTVLIQGRNLQQLVYALKESRCTFIQDFHAEEYAPVTNMQEPFIEKLILAMKPRPGEKVEADKKERE